MIPVETILQALSYNKSWTGPTPYQDGFDEKMVEKWWKDTKNSVLGCIISDMTKCGVKNGEDFETLVWSHVQRELAVYLDLTYKNPVGAWKSIYYRASRLASQELSREPRLLNTLVEKALA